jgi:hypothetical protein
MAGALSRGTCLGVPFTFVARTRRLAREANRAHGQVHCLTLENHALPFPAN